MDMRGYQRYREDSLSTMTQGELLLLLFDELVKRLTQADIARMTGIRAGTINDLYHEIATRISLEHLDLLCEALDCDISDLLTRSKRDSPYVAQQLRHRAVHK